MRVTRHQLGWALGLGAGVALLAWGAAWVGNFIEDDTLISLRYAERLLSGHGLTWNDGERVEGYSNLAWILGVSGLAALGVDLILAARLLAFACWGAALIALSRFAKRVDASPVGFAAASIMLGASMPLSVWAMGALEQPLVVACVAVAFIGLADLAHTDGISRRGTFAAAAALALLVWTRPDAPLLVATVATAGFALDARRGSGRALRTFALLAGVPLFAWCLQLGFRLVYYGEWLPNPAHIKTHLRVDRAREGAVYVGRGLAAGWLLFGAGAAGAVSALVRRETRPLALAVLALVAVWGAYVVAIGGDHFPAYRHLLVVHLCAAVLVVLGLSRWHQAGRVWVPIAALVVVSGLVIPYVGTQRRINDINVAKRARWQWDGRAVGETFANSFAREQPLWAVTAAGCLPYFSRLPALDLLGLNDAHIARQPPDPRLPLAHDHGDGDYVLRRAPDLITFGLPRGRSPIFKSGMEMAGDARFREGYQRARFRTLQPTTVLTDTYVRRSGRVGWTVDPSGVRAPAYLLRGSLGHPLPEGVMGARFDPGRKTRLELPELPAGRYRVRTVPERTDIRLRIVASAPILRRDTMEPGAFEMAESARLRLEVTSRHLSILLREIVVERVDPAEHLEGPLVRVALVREGTGDASPSMSQGVAIEAWSTVGEPHAEVRVSAPFTVAKSAWLSFRISGDVADVHADQVGVRVVDDDNDTVLTVFTGRKDGEAREVRADLTLFAGHTVRIEVFDLSRRASIEASGFRLHER